MLHASSPFSKRAGKTERPSVAPEPVDGDDEDRTLLFEGSHRSMLPPRPKTPVTVPPIARAKMPVVNMRGQVVRDSERPPSPQSLRGSDRPAGPESLRGAVRRASDPEDRTVLRPTSTLPAQLQRPAAGGPAIAPSTPSAAPSPPTPRPPSPRAPAAMPTPFVPMTPAKARPSAPPVAVDATGGTDARRSDFDPPSSVVTARTRIVRRANASWAMGLVAVGAIVGLATAVVVRGDADAVIDATAGFVELAHGAPHANGAAAQAAVLPSFVETGRRAVPAGTDQNPAPGACLDNTAASSAVSVSAPIVVNPPPMPAASSHAPDAKVASLAGADPSAASHATPPRPSPVAYAAPVRAAAPPPAAPRPAPAQHDTTQGSWLAGAGPSTAGAPASKGAKATAAAAPKPAGDFETAAAADALAKAQLEASLK